MALALIQFALQAYFFPVTELLSDKRLMHIDSAFHQYMMHSSVAHCKDGQLAGYDPYFHAGFISGVVPDLSSKLQALTACAVGSHGAVTPIFKLYSFGLGWIGPVLPVLAAVLWGLPARVVGVVAFFALLMAWTGPMRWYHTAGMSSFVAAAHLSLLFAALMFRACAAPGLGRVALAAAVASLGAILHPLFVVPAALLALPMMFAAWWAGAKLKQLLLVALVVSVLTLLTNAFWLWPWLTQPAYDTSVAHYQRFVDPLLWLREALGVAPTAKSGSRLYAVLLLAAAAGLLDRASTTAATARLRGLAVGAALLLALSSIGGHSQTIAALQPNRFSLPAWIALIIPASAGVVCLLHLASQRPSAQRWLAWACLVPVVFLSLAFAKDAVLEVFGERTARYAVTRPEVKGDGIQTQALQRALRQHTDPSARVFFETSLGRVVDDTHAVASLALDADREFIGGPYPFIGQANAWDGVAFGQALESYTPTALASQLDQYNVRWMLCHSTACQSAMAALPGARKLAEIGAMHLYERRMEPSFFIAGQGQVLARCLGRLEVAATPGTGPLVLKYHWVPGLRASAGVQLEAHHVKGNPRPFIALRNPAARTVISTSPGREVGGLP